jgi:DNA-3-methyladenine glycosylase
MFGPPGRTYIYLIYGMYHCLNFVTEPDGSPAAVLLRAAELVEGRSAILLPPKAKKNDPCPLSGPGKFCRALGMTRDQNDLDLTGDLIYLQDRNDKAVNIHKSGRIGINVGIDRPWRFYDGDSAAVTRSRPVRRKN